MAMAMDGFVIGCLTLSMGFNALQGYWLMVTTRETVMLGHALDATLKRNSTGQDEDRTQSD
jgi:hypothetical protein